MFDEGAVVRLRADALCARLEASLDAGAEGVLASDGDGTLWRCDIGDALFDTLVDGGELREAARDALAEEAGAAGLGGDGDANVLARRLRDAYRRGALDEARYFALQAWSYAGWDVSALRARGREVLDDIGFDASVRASMRRVLAWCEARKLPLYLVSASPRPIVDAAAERLGLPRERVVAMEPNIAGDLVGTGLASVATYAMGKVSRLEAVVGASPLLAAFGDGRWDAELLERAAYPVMVEPRPALRAALVGFDGVFELEDA